MGLLQSYGHLVSSHPGKVIISTIIFVIALLLLTLVIKTPPTFKDPLVGFETRNTIISNKLNTWRLLMDESQASANNLSLAMYSTTFDWSSQEVPLSPGPLYNNEVNSPDFDEPPIVEMSTQLGKLNYTSAIDSLDEGEDEYYRTVNMSGNNGLVLMHYSLDSSKAFCGKLYEGYGQAVVSPSIRYSSSGLFNLNSLLAICQLDGRLRLEQSTQDSHIFQKECESFQETSYPEVQVRETCCNSWTLPNYVACLNNKTSCMDIDTRDVKNMEYLLNLCTPFYLHAPYEDCFIGQKKDDSFTHDKSSLDILSSSTRSGLPRSTKSQCGDIPDKCLACNGWTYTVLHYLVSDGFVQNRVSSDSHNIKPSSTLVRWDRLHRFYPRTKDSSFMNRLQYTNIFLPIAKSSSLMEYYQALSNVNLRTPHAQIKALDLGLKNSLFEYLISDDTKLFVIALISIMLIISVYTWSLILSFVILAIICLSLCLSFAIYELVLGIPVFPFMNLLAVVISFGICSDNAMLFCKQWSNSEESQDGTDIQKHNNLDDQVEPETIQSLSTHTSSVQPIQILEAPEFYAIDKRAIRERANLHHVFKRSIICTLTVTLATAVSFMVSAISRVVAVRCFCIFASLSVITNYLLIILLLPPALVLDFRLSESIHKLVERNAASESTKHFIEFIYILRERFLDLGRATHLRCIYHIVTELRLYTILAFIPMLSVAALLVFHHPTMQPADEDAIQLLSSKHSFEQYDKTMRRQFIFERVRQGEQVVNSSRMAFETPETLPVRIVFGLEPADTGNHLDPHDRGSLIFDPLFDMSDANAQSWMVGFCHKLRHQRFIHPSSSGEFSNCFMETYKTWMESRSCRDPVNRTIDHSPCCQTAEFPFEPPVFHNCLGEAIQVMRRTPTLNPNLSTGVRFFKNSDKIAAVIIEYPSNRLYSESFHDMNDFYLEINEWVEWQINNTAPPSLKSGFFLSANLEILALQTELLQSTTQSILIEILLAGLALLIGTRDLVLTLVGALTIGSIIILTVGSLIILRWTLGVAESILISLTIGLSVDFALHYTVAFGEARRDRPTRSSRSIMLGVLDQVSSPIGLATVTTSAAGFVIFWSDILAYQELGIFLMLIAMLSWLTSTFFLLPLLSACGSLLVDHPDLDLIQLPRAWVRRALKLLIDRL